MSTALTFPVVPHGIKLACFLRSLASWIRNSCWFAECKPVRHVVRDSLSHADSLLRVIVLIEPVYLAFCDMNSRSQNLGERLNWFSSKELEQNVKYLFPRFSKVSQLWPEFSEDTLSSLKPTFLNRTPQTSMPRLKTNVIMLLPEWFGKIAAESEITKHCSLRTGPEGETAKCTADVMVSWFS